MKHALFYPCFLLATILSTGPHALYAAKDPYVVAATESDPAAFVEHSVNVITGDFVMQDQGFTVQGTQPIRIQHAYISGSGEGKTAGWSFIPHLYLHLDIYTCLVEVPQPSGTVLTFQLPFDPNYKPGRKYKFPGTVVFGMVGHLETGGMSNTAHQEIGARSNLKNQWAEMDDSETIFIHTSEGSTRCYQKLPYSKMQPKLNYALQWEKLANGNKITYSYDSSTRLVSIKTTNPEGSKVYASMNVSHLGAVGESCDFDVKTSDRQLLNYRFKTKTVSNEKVFVLDKILLNGKPNQVVHHLEAREGRKPLISHRFLPGGHIQQVEYYEPSENAVGDQKITIDGVNDPRCHRVKAIYAMTDDELKQTHRFIYTPGEKGSHSGHTEVYDANDNRTVYYYTSSLHLERIERFYHKQGREGLYNRERFVFGKEKTPQSGLLLCKTLMDHDGNSVVSKQFTYDSRGNVIQETLYGDLSGASVELELNDAGFPIDNGVEKYTKRFTYNERDLKIREEEDNGKTTLFTYHQGTDRLASQLILEKGQTKIRHFYEYNQDLILVREIVDDGISSNKEDLTGVTERRIKKITPRSEAFLIGMPSVVEQKFLDLVSGQEKLLKKIVFTYSDAGKVTSQAIFDATNHLAYNAKGELETSEELNKVNHWLEQGLPQAQDSLLASGAVKQRVFEIKLPDIIDRKGNRIQPKAKRVCDVFGNDVFVEDASGEVTTFAYNARGQLTQTHYPDRTSTRVVYHLDGTVKEKIDQEGNVTTFLHDAFGRQTATEVLAAKGESIAKESDQYNSFHLLKHCDAAGFVTHYAYDGAGRLKHEKVANYETIYSYDAMGYLNLTQAGSGKETKRTFTIHHPRGNIVEERIEDGERNVYSRVLYQYGPSDQEMLVKRVVDGKESIEVFKYDTKGRLVEHKNAVEVVKSMEYNEQFENAIGQKVVKKTETDTLGVATTEVQDAYGRIVFVEKKNKQRQPLTRRALFYDAAGHLTSEETHVFAEGKSMRKLEKKAMYGLMGRVQTVTEAVGTDAERATHYTYTKTGLVSEIVKPRGHKIQNIYDALGRRTQLISSDGSVNYVYRYNGRGELLEVENLNTKELITRAYDAKGNMLHEISSSNGSNEVKTAYTYDVLGRRATIVLPDQTTIEYVYEGLFPKEVNRKTVSGETVYTHRYNTFDASGHLLEEQLMGDLGKVNYRLDTLGRQVGIASTHSTQEVQSFHQDGQISQFSYKSGCGEAQIHYTYNGLGQLTEETGPFAQTLAWDSDGGLLRRNGKTAHHNILGQLFSTDASEFTFDARGNPLSKKTRYGEIKYAYDSLGHLVEVVNPDGKRLAFQGADLYQLHTLTPLLSPDCILYSYDANGNILSKRSPEGDFYFFYDALDRLVEVIKPQEIRLCMTYDGLNRRQTKARYQWRGGAWHETKHLSFFWDQNQEAGVQEIGAMSKGHVAQLRVPGARLEALDNRAVAVEINGIAYVPHYDIRGHIAFMLYPQSGKLAECYQYSGVGFCRIFNPQGEKREISVIGNPWRFSGESIDEETSFLYQGRRVFDPEIGLWVNP